MNFSDVEAKKEVYKTLTEMMRDHRRKEYINLKSPTIQEIKQKMFDNWDVENIYMYGEALQKNIFITNELSLFVEITKDMFEDMVDSFYIQEELNSVNFGFNVEGVIYYYKDNRWIQGGESPIYKLKL